VIFSNFYIITVSSYKLAKMTALIPTATATSTSTSADTMATHCTGYWEQKASKEKEGDRGRATTKKKERRMPNAINKHCKESIACLSSLGKWQTHLGMLIK